MTSPKIRQVVSQRSWDKEGHDPWCLVCGVNLALEGRTFTVLTRHNDAELCDTFSRVLGAEFSPDYASANMCNRCERQLRRLGRYSSIVLARREGVSLREQLEKNLAKHGQQVIEVGQIEEQPSTAAVASTSSTADKNHIWSSSCVVGEVYRGRSSIKKSWKRPSRSVGSVHFEEDGEKGRREAIVRKFSAPEGSFKPREPLSLASQVQRFQLVQRRKWSNTSSTSEESLPLSPTISPDKTSPLIIDDFEGFSALRQRDAFRSSLKTASREQQEFSEEEVSDVSAQKLEELVDEKQLKDSQQELVEDKPPGYEQQELVEVKPLSESQQETTQDNTQEVLVTRVKERSADEDMASDTDRATLVENDEVEASALTRMDTLQADTEFIENLGAEMLKDSPDPSEDEYIEDNEDNGPDPADPAADTRSNLSDVEERITTKTKFKGAYYNIGSTEDLLQEFANEQDRERALWSKLTFTESIDVGDSGLDLKPVRPPRKKSARSAHRNKGDQESDRKHSLDEAAEQTPTENGPKNTQDGEPGKEDSDKVKANGVLLDQKSGVNPDESLQDETPVLANENSATAGVATQPGLKTEKSPLIGSSELKMSNGKESRVKDQLPGFLCCNII